MSDPQQIAALIAAKKAEILAKFQSIAPQQPAPPPKPKTNNHIRPPMSATAARPPPQQPQISGLSASEIERKAQEVRNLLQGVKAEKRKAAAPPMPLDESGFFDLKAMLDKGIIPKRETELKAKQRLAASKSATAAVAASEEEPSPSTLKQKNEKITTLKLESTPESFTDPTKNPYFDPSLPVKIEPKARRAKAFKFVQPGKYIEKANQERAKAQLEKLKEQVAAKVKQAGMEMEMDVSDKVLKKEPPPVAEWWDVPFLPNQTYHDLDDEKITIDPTQLTSLVTSYVHHPIVIKPPNGDQQQNIPIRALTLTKKERKKLRRQRRLETQKDKQDKIRLGLLPPDPPKVKISNLMRVLGDEAIQDPTKVEAKVRKEMEQRQKQHDLANQQRKLTPEEKRAKIMNKLADDQSVSNEVAVFKIKNCSHPKHRFKIEKNAHQYGLTGIVIVHPKCHMVIVEGGPKSIKAYKKLMLRRIDWNDLPTPKNLNNNDNNMDIDSGASSLLQQQQQQPNNNITDNKCYLIWTGQVKSKAFKKFTWRSFESEKMAREELTKWHAENYWDLALRANEEDLEMRQVMI